MLKNKSMEYIFGMITGISVSITFWACTNTDLIASNDASVESNTVQQVEITNWSDMPSGGTVTFPSSIDVHLKSVPIGGLDVDVDLKSWPNSDLDVDFPIGGLDVYVDGSILNPMYVKITDVPYNCCD